MKFFTFSEWAFWKVRHLSVSVPPYLKKSHSQSFFRKTLFLTSNKKLERLWLLKVYITIGSCRTFHNQLSFVSYILWTIVAYILQFFIFEYFEFIKFLFYSLNTLMLGENFSKTVPCKVDVTMWRNHSFDGIIDLGSLMGSLIFHI